MASFFIPNRPGSARRYGRGGARTFSSSKLSETCPHVELGQRPDVYILKTVRNLGVSKVGAGRGRSTVPNRPELARTPGWGKLWTVYSSRPSETCPYSKSGQVVDEIRSQIVRKPPVLIGYRIVASS